MKEGSLSLSRCPYSYLCLPSKTALDLSPSSSAKNISLPRSRPAPRPPINRMTLSNEETGKLRKPLFWRHNSKHAATLLWHARYTQVCVCFPPPVREGPLFFSPLCMLDCFFYPWFTLDSVLTLAVPREVWGKSLARREREERTLV